MSETRHTPGPLVVTYDPDIDPEVYNVEDSQGNTVAHVFALDGEEASLAEADADLFAAAQDLLAVAKAVLLFHAGSPWDQTKDADFNALLFPILGREPAATTKGICDAARTAIDKAEGR